MDGFHSSERVYAVLFPFCGVGGGALGFKLAVAELTRLGITGRFRILGGIESDPSTARDFDLLTGAPCLCAKVEELTPETLRAAFGAEAPDVVFFSPPCKPASGLLSKGLAATPRYRAMAMLGAVWVDLMFETWPEGPRLLIMENVPRIRTRAPEMMAHIRKVCRARRYLIHEATHNLGEVGGLAQNRDRLLFVGRRDDVTALLYQPLKRRVRSVGEVLGDLPLPGDPAAGPLHQLPAIEAITALRLALIPAGGDWKDLPSTVHLHPEVAALLGQKRARPSKDRKPFNDVWRVVRWDAAAGAVTCGGTPSAGGMSVADPRLNLGPNGHTSICAVTGWDSVARTVTGASRPASGAFSVADPRTRVESHPHTYGVIPWDGAAHTVTGNTATPGGGPFTVADPRITCTPRENAGSYGVVPWGEASGTILAHACHDNGRFSVADPRFSVADPRFVERCPFPVIIAEDGTWHRPLTALECAVLQGFEPSITLSGGSSAARVKIGDAVPPPAARRIAEQMLHTLLLADSGSFALSSGGGVWVRERQIAGHA